MIRYDVCVQYSGKYAPKKLDLKVTIEHDIKYRRTTNPTLTFNQVILLPYIILIFCIKGYEIYTINSVESFWKST